MYKNQHKGKILLKIITFFTLYIKYNSSYSSYFYILFLINVCLVKPILFFRSSRNFYSICTRVPSDTLVFFYLTSS